VNRSFEFRHVLPGFPPPAWKLDPAAKSQRYSSVSLPHGIQALPLPTGARAATPLPRYPSSRAFPLCRFPPCPPPPSPSRCPLPGRSTPRPPLSTSFSSPTLPSPMCEAMRRQTRSFIDTVQPTVAGVSSRDPDIRPTAPVRSHGCQLEPRLELDSIWWPRPSEARGTWRRSRSGGQTERCGSGAFAGKGDVCLASERSIE
jgi:hypothetical protein